MPRQLKVFLCHAHSDKDTVKALYARLKREGVDVWLDKEKLLPGADWEFEIRKAVRESDVVIVCLSKQFNQAGFRQKEVRIALEEADNKPPGEIFIIPARLEECDNLETLSKWHWVDLFESDGFQRLILALRIRAEKIGAALRQRGATISRQKKNIEQPDAEKERIENTSQEDEERLRLAKEQEDRESQEKTAQAKAEREKTECQTAERITVEKERLEKQKPVAQPAPVIENKTQSMGKPSPKLNVRRLGIGGIIFAGLLIAMFGGNYLLKNINSAPTQTSIVIPPTTTKTKTPPPTQTFTPVPPTFTPTPGIGSTQVSKKDGMTLVFVPAGEFTMGSDTYPDEEPIHQVNLDAFWIDQTEVTNSMYAQCVTGGGCTIPPSSSSSSTRGSYYGNSEFDNYPVIYVEWNQANAYCSWAGRRLPTEAEWEKAARGPYGRTYPWGEEIDCDKANYNYSCVGDTTKVGSYPSGASIYGALDMAGNVWEWVSSLYQDYPYDVTDGREDLTASGPRVLRGGSWYSYNDLVRSAYPSRLDPANAGNNLGFRCALSP